jgi:hypothetical protein
MPGPPKGLLGPAPRLPLAGPPAPGLVTFSTEDPDASVSCETEGATPFPPEPVIDEVQRAGAISLTPWVRQNPYRMDVHVRLDGFPDRSVEPKIAILEGFAEVPAGRAEPSAVTVTGAIPRPHPNIKWQISGFDTPTVDYVNGGKERCRYETVVHLVQKVTDRVLIESLRATSKSKGVKARSITVRAGEDWLFEVARRAYKDPSRAGDIAAANSLHLGKKLTPGTVLRLP